MPSNDCQIPKAKNCVGLREAIQSELIASWAPLLGIEQVELDNTFLLLGGESLLAVQAVAQVRERFGYELSIRSIFTKTVAEIAAEIAAARPDLRLTSATGSVGRAMKLL